MPLSAIAPLPHSRERRLKSDLRRELPDVLSRLPDYLADAASGRANPEHAHFTTKRRAIRDALAADGVAKEIDALVAALLNA